jgi:CheY-like chemotaxis protein
LVQSTVSDISPLARIRFQVEDSGIGIPSDQLEKIFSAFHQVHDERVYAEGTGLGLAISQRLVRMMGGELYVESEVNQGSIFWFEVAFPVIGDIHVQDDLHTQGHQIIGIQGNAPTVLLADDNETNRAVLRDLLVPLGFHVVEVNNGQQLVEKAVEMTPMFMLVDLVMPVMDGLAAVRRIRSYPDLREVVIIAISASVSIQREQESLRAGCDAFLAKPFHVEHLLDLIQRYLNIEWIYRDSIREQQTVFSKNAQHSAEQNLIVPPPQEELDTLHQIAMIGQITKLRRTLDAIEATDARYRPFVGHIRQLAKEFHIEAIQEYIEHYLYASEES